MRLCWTLFLLLIGGGSILAADTARLTVRVNDAPPVEMGPRDLASLPRHTAALTSHGKTAQFEGVLFSEVLRKAGVDFGKGLHGKQLAAYVSAVATDGYDVVFGLAEFDPTIEDSDILIADKQDGASLPENEGPLRVIVPHDKKPLRSVRMLKEIDVMQLGR